MGNILCGGNAKWLSDDLEALVHSTLFHESAYRGPLSVSKHKLSMPHRYVHTVSECREATGRILEFSMMDSRDGNGEKQRAGPNELAKRLKKGRLGIT